MRIEPWAWQPQSKAKQQPCRICEIAREERITDIEPHEHEPHCFRYRPYGPYYPAWLVEEE